MGWKRFFNPIAFPFPYLCRKTLTSGDRRILRAGEPPADKS